MAASSVLVISGPLDRSCAGTIARQSVKPVFGMARV